MTSHNVPPVGLEEQFALAVIGATGVNPRRPSMQQRNVYNRVVDPIDVWRQSGAVDMGPQDETAPTENYLALSCRRSLDSVNDIVGAPSYTGAEMSAVWSNRHIILNRTVEYARKDTRGGLQDVTTLRYEIPRGLRQYAPNDEFEKHAVIELRNTHITGPALREHTQAINRDPRQCTFSVFEGLDATIAIQAAQQLGAQILTLARAGSGSGNTNRIRLARHARMAVGKLPLIVERYTMPAL